MAEAKQCEAWNHTAHLLAMLANINRSEKSPPVKPSVFHPFLNEKKVEPDVMANPIGINVLKIFLPK